MMKFFLASLIICLLSRQGHLKSTNETLASILKKIPFDTRSPVPRLMMPPVQAPETRGAIQTESFSCVTNHFSWFSRQTFPLRFASNDQFFDGSGPMIVLLCGESPIENYLGYLYSGQMFEIAQEFGAYMFVLEHRFYGESVPNMNLDTLNMGTLTLNQVIQDIAQFIYNRKNNVLYLQSSKVIVMGGSYGGTLATWARYKCPHIIDAAIASSAPLQATMDYYQNFEMVQQSLTTASGGNDRCVNVIKNTVTSIKNRLNYGVSAQQLQTDFGLCEPLNVQDSTEVTNFFANFAYVISTIVQYSDITTLTSFCNILTDDSNNYDDYTRLVQVYSTVSGMSGCFPTYKSTVTSFKSLDLSPDHNRVWFYQMCTQFGFFTTTSAPDQPFDDTVPVEFYSKMCIDTFGIFYSSVKTEVGVSTTNQQYKSVRSPVTNVITTQGSLDPWSSLGFIEDARASAPVVVIKGTSHCADMLPSSSNDCDDLKRARKRVKTYTAKCIGRRYKG